MDKAEKELVVLEQEYWRALKDKNTAVTLRLTDDPCIVAASQGVGQFDKHQMTEMMKQPGWSLEDFELKDLHVRMLADDVAIVAYKVRENMTVDGKDVTLEAADASTWIRRDGRWVCALHTESLIGDPFGRDRNLS